MADKRVELIIDMKGNAISGVTHLGTAIEGAQKKIGRLKAAFATIGSVGSGLMGVIYSVTAITDKFKEFTEASNAQNIEQSKLAKVMQNTMGASDAEYKSILALTAAQQKLGIVGDEVQLAGAQELGTYVTKADTLKQLIPVMNDMVAQQYGVNASQEEAVNIGSMIGKVMNGQVGALSRYGYKFDEAQAKIIKFGTEEQKLAAVTQIVEEAVGGVNEALAQSPEGKIKQMENRMGDIKEQVGNIFNQLKIAAMPLMEGVVGWLEDMVPKLMVIIEPAQRFVQYLMSWLQQLQPLWNAIFSGISNTLKGVFTDTGKWMDYVNIVKDLFTEHILPAVQRILAVIGRVGAKVAEFYRNSELVKDIFRTIGDIVGGLIDAFAWIFDKLTWIWEHTVLPIMKAIEWIYKKIKGSDGNELKVTQTVKTPAPKTIGLASKSNTATGSATSTPSAATSGAKSAVTGGTRNTQITIHLGKMTENVVFNGTLGEKKEELLEQFKEYMLQAIYAAGNANV